LADGRTVPIDSITSGTLATQGNVNLVSKHLTGRSFIMLRKIIAGQIQYNTLTNPKGSKVVDMTLADGSRVWLNAGSSVTYPIAFIGKERGVSITGEAYFEVTHNSSDAF
jgi:transmembrane sensor